MKLAHVKNGISDGIPIVIGYIPIAITFGLLSKTTGITILDSGLLSIMVFAGASQFMAVNMIAVGSGLSEIIISTFLVNFRHFLMSASLSQRLDLRSKGHKFITAFGVTDEVFSVASFKSERLSFGYIVSLQITSYLSWVGGTFLGYVIGQVLPQKVTSSMGIALYAMFVALLIPEIKTKASTGLVALTAAAVNTILYYSGLISKGWCIIAAILVASAVGAAFIKEGEECLE